MEKSNTPNYYIDEKGRKYCVLRRSCFAVLGRIAEEIHVLYEDGSRAVLPREVHEKHSKLADIIDIAQSSPKCEQSKPNSQPNRQN